MAWIWPHSLDLAHRPSPSCWIQCMWYLFQLVQNLVRRGLASWALGCCCGNKPWCHARLLPVTAGAPVPLLSPGYLAAKLIRTAVVKLQQHYRRNPTPLVVACCRRNKLWCQTSSSSSAVAPAPQVMPVCLAAPAGRSCAAVGASALQVSPTVNRAKAKAVGWMFVTSDLKLPFTYNTLYYIFYPVYKLVSVWFCYTMWPHNIAYMCF